MIIIALRAFGFKNVDYLLPERLKGGYGLTPDRVGLIKKMGANLVITVDSGSRDLSEIADLEKSNINVLVTDHHELGKELPAAHAVINPKRKDSNYPFKELAGVGVAFKFVRALQKRLKGIPEGQEKWLLDLVAIGTICDMTSLTNENRINVFYGMKVLAKSHRHGLNELIKTAGIETISSEAIGFQIGPRLNAAGRIKTPTLALDLLLERNIASSYTKAKMLDDLNQERKMMQEQAMEEVSNDHRVDFSSPILFVHGEKWHEGIIGILAGKLLSKYHKPVFVFTGSGTSLKGSARSFGDFSLAQAVDYCSDLLIKGGGHNEAAGVLLEQNNYSLFQKRCIEFYGSLKLKDQAGFFEISEDASTTNLRELDESMYKKIMQLGPFGEGNAEPIIKLENVLILDIKRIGTRRQHLMLRVRGVDGGIMRLISFSAPEEWLKIDNGQMADVWISLCLNDFRGIKSVEGRILHVRHMEF